MEPAAGPGARTAGNAGSGEEPGFGKATLVWIRAHPVKTFGLLLALFLIFELATVPWFDVAGLKTRNPKTTALMEQRLDEAKEKGRTLRIVHAWIPLSRIPKAVVHEVIVAEDGTFYTHGGIDWFEVQQSVERDIEARRAVRGASTITQQLAKNLYLSTSKDPIRKLKEVLIAILMEHELSKDRILELYLNEIEWGRGIFGIQAAAQTYFGKSAADLTIEEGARLAAVIPSPLRHRPDGDSRYVRRRTQIVLNRLYARYVVRHPEAAGDTAEIARGVMTTEGDSVFETLPPIDSTDTDEADSDGL